MKIKLFWVGFMAIFVLFGCTNTNEEGMKDKGRDGNIEQTRFNDGTNNDRMNNRTNNRQTRHNDNRFNNRNNNMSNERDGNENQYEISKEAADKIVDEVKEIGHAYVLTTKNNAYVAATLDHEDRKGSDRNGQNKNRNNNVNNMKNNKRANDSKTKGEELTDDVKNKIADIVQSVDNDIDNVYVSTNPDFVNLTTDYADNIESGKPIRGFFDEIGNMIERVFPQNKR